MYKQYRVGKIKYVTNKRLGNPHILLDAWEHCLDTQGAGYVATYNLWIALDDKTDITRDDVGRFCEVGFYTQSFRVRDMNDSYNTVLSLRSFKFLMDEDEAVLRAIEIRKSIF